ncbi:MAG: phosphate acetyltransferase [Clostridiales Family XIII bacterium]|jgi:phosphate acetyltransferase|nr:phosphate acetyltransferase [Clostridiales Family XIII bacterium]
MIDRMIEDLRSGNKKTIVFPEGSDPRILEAANRLAALNILSPLLIGNEEEILAAAKRADINADGLRITSPDRFSDTERMLSEMIKLRKGKMTEQECRETLKKSNYFGVMLVKLGYADGLLGGATYSTADTVRPALQLVKTKPGNNIVSSSLIITRTTEAGKETYVMGDCAINVTPTEDELVEITMETVATARIFSVDPKVALLSYSTLGSAKGADVDKIRNAVKKLKEMNVDYPVDGELQFDAALSPTVAGLKAPGSSVAGHANCFIFPDVASGNIGYKIAQRLGGFEAIGPILQGLNAPVNDLSRGCTADEAFKMAVITAALA